MRRQHRQAAIRRWMTIMAVVACGIWCWIVTEDLRNSSGFLSIVTLLLFLSTLSVPILLPLGIVIFRCSKAMLKHPWR